jgi:hypothetical protein
MVNHTADYTEQTAWTPAGAFNDHVLGAKT